MQSTLTGLVILGVAIMIAFSSRDNTNETAAQTFGTLAVILVLALIGLSFVRKGEAERLRNKKKGPTKSTFKPPMPGAVKHSGPVFAPEPSFELPEGAQKALLALVGVLVLGGSIYGIKTVFFPPAISALAKLESSKEPDKGKEKLAPILDKAAERFGQDRDDIDDMLLSVWEANQESLRDYGLKPSSFAREVLAAAPKTDPDFEKLATALAQEKPAERLARLHQPKPAPGSYPQQAAFQKALDGLHKKTNINAKPLTATLVKRWRVVFEKKKQNRKYSLLWFVQVVNSKTKPGTQRDAWIAKVAKMGL